MRDCTIQNPQAKKIALASLLLLSVLMALVVNLYFGVDVVYTHVFYIPIICAGIWYHRRALWVAAGLGLLHIICDSLSAHHLTGASWMSALVFIGVALAVALISEKRDALYNELHKINQAMLDMVIEVDPDGIIHYVSPSSMNVLGYTPEELLQRSIFDQVHPEDLPSVKAQYDAALSGRQSLSLTCRYRRKDGIYSQIEAAANPLSDVSGGLESCIIRFRDIAKRKQAEDEVIRTKQLLADVIDFLPDATYVVDQDKRVIIWNRAMEDMSGVPKEEILGQGDYAYTIPFWGDRRTNMLDLIDVGDEEIDRNYKDIHRQGNHMSAEAFCPALYNGKGAHLLGVTAPLHDETGKRIGIIQTIRDISVLKESIESFEALFMKSPDAYMIMEIDRGVISDCNEATGIMLRGSREQIIGKTPDEVSPGYQPDGRLSSKAAAEKIAESLRDGGNRFEWVHQRLTGEDFWTEVCISTITLHGRSVLLVAWRDITGRKRLEEEQNRLMKELQRSNAELEQFAFVASHDLRAPLRAIESLSLWLEEDLAGILPAESAEHLWLLRERTKRMEALLDSLLEYSRIGRKKAEVVLVDTAALVKNIIDSLDISGRFAVTMTDLPCFSTARGPLNQVLSNLIGNVAKHHDLAKGCITVAAVQSDNLIEFSVIDDGPGIPEQYREKVFGMFQTLKPRDEVEGSGMGLALVRKIVEYNGGSVTIHAAEPRGAEVRFSWPLEIKGG